MSVTEAILCDTNTRHSPEHYFVRNDLEDCFLLMFFKTPYVYKKNGKILTGEKYSYLINPPFSVAEHGSLNEGFINDWIFLRGSTAEKIIKEFNLPLNEPFHIDNFSIIYSYISKISTELILKHTSYLNKVSCLICDMLISLGRQYEFINQSTHPAFCDINNARNFMLNNIEKKITIKSLAELSNYSESRFCILYNRFFGSSPIEDLLNARIEKAVSLLGYSKISVTETAKLCGFSSVHYFSRKFKERTGVTPTHYLK